MLTVINERRQVHNKHRFGAQIGPGYSFSSVQGRLEEHAHVHSSRTFKTKTTEVERS